MGIRTSNSHLSHKTVANRLSNLGELVTFSFHAWPGGVKRGNKQNKEQGRGEGGGGGLELLTQWRLYHRPCVQSVGGTVSVTMVRWSAQSVLPERGTLGMVFPKHTTRVTPLMIIRTTTTTTTMMMTTTTTTILLLLERRNLRLFTISSLGRELSPIRTLKWPGRDRVQITCSTSNISRATWYEGTAQLLSLTEFKSHLF